MILIFIAFLFACWNNKVTAAGSVLSKNDKKTTSEWYLVSHSFPLLFTLICTHKNCPLLLVVFTTCPTGFFCRTPWLLTSKQQMQFVIRQQSPDWVILGFVIMQNTWIANFMTSHTSASFQHGRSGRFNKSPAEMFAVMHLDLTLTSWSGSFPLEFTLKAVLCSIWKNIS